MLEYNSLDEVPKQDPETNQGWVTGSRIKINGVEHIYNSANQKWTELATTTGTPATGTTTPGGQTTTTTTTEPAPRNQPVLYDEQPNIIWEEELVARPGGAPSTRSYEKNWFDAKNYLNKLKAAGNVSEYNKWVEALVNSPFWGGGKVTKTKVNSAFVDALKGSAINQKSIQSILFRPDGTEEVALGIQGTAGGVSKANQLENYKRLIKRYAVQQGVDITDDKVSELASVALAQSWDSPTISENVARSGVITGEKGNVANYIDRLKADARNYGVAYNDLWFDQAAASIVQGYSSIEDYQQQIKEYSKQIYPAFTKQIDSGVTPYAIASPYINTMANILEISANDINLNDPTISMALKNVDAEGNPSVKPLWQFEKDLRQDPRWRFTNNAQQDLMGTARQVLQDFGLVS